MHKIILDGGSQLNNKILVHCHAGQGRTAIIIGAYLLYAGITDSAPDAVKICKQGRPKLFKNKSNVVYLNYFNKFLQELSELFPPAVSAVSLEKGLTIKSILKKQRLLL